MALLKVFPRVNGIDLEITAIENFLGIDGYMKIFFHVSVVMGAFFFAANDKNVGVVHRVLENIPDSESI
jgi:hypothetical protein